jgi:hypothetical protein
MPRTLRSLILLLTALCLTTVAQRRTLSVSQQRDPPILIESIDLAGRILQPGVEFNAPAGWTEVMNIRVKNNTEEPISRIEMILGVFPVTDPTNAALTAHYWFGNRQNAEFLLQPGATTTLIHIGTKGDYNVPGTTKLTLTNVTWNGDDSLRWDGGGIRRKESGGGVTGEPPIYKRIDGPVAQVRNPFHPS